MAWPANERAEAHVEVDVVVAVDVLEPRALGPAHHDGVRVVGLERRRDAHRQGSAGALGGRCEAGRALGVGVELAPGDRVPARTDRSLGRIPSQSSSLLADNVVAHATRRRNPSWRPIRTCNRRAGRGTLAALVAVAQLVRASGCGPECRGFESRRSPQCEAVQRFGGAAYTAERDRASSSTAEQRTLNPQVLGSKPRGRTTKHQLDGDTGCDEAGSPLPTRSSRVRYPLNYPVRLPCARLPWAEEKHGPDAARRGGRACPH